MYINHWYACLRIFSVIRAAIGLAIGLRKMKTAIASSDENRDDFINRTAALTLQTCLLNCMSQFGTGLATLLSSLSVLLAMAQFDELAASVWNLGAASVFIPQCAVVFCSSNIGFLLHCYYSKVYREATWETFAELKASFKAKLSRFKLSIVSTGFFSEEKH